MHGMTSWNQMKKYYENKQVDRMKSADKNRKWLLLLRGGSKGEREGGRVKLKLDGTTQMTQSTTSLNRICRRNWQTNWNFQIHQIVTMHHNMLVWIITKNNNLVETVMFRFKSLYGVQVENIIYTIFGLRPNNHLHFDRMLGKTGQ